jgi:hypothetical protein
VEAVAVREGKKEVTGLLCKKPKKSLRGVSGEMPLFLPDSIEQRLIAPGPLIPFTGCDLNKPKPQIRDMVEMQGMV